MPDESESVSPLQSYLELLRLPNVFTAVADVAMGFFFVAVPNNQAAGAFSDDPRQTFLPAGLWTIGLLAATLALLYSAGMVLNDVFDIELDRQEQPYRPLPSGRIPLSSARWLGWQLLTLGIMLASGTAVMLGKVPLARTDSFILSWLPAIVAAALAVLIVLYNAGLKRTLLGPLAMGGCRMLNVLLGMSVLRVVADRALGGCRGHRHLYRRRDLVCPNDARRSDRRQLVAALFVMLAGVGLVGSLPWLAEELWIIPQWHKVSWNWCGIIALMAGFVLVRGVPAIAQPSPGPVRAAVSRSITALIFLDAAACYAAAGPFYAILVAVLVIPTTIVGRWVDAG